MSPDPIEIAREAVALDSAAHGSRKSEYAAHVAACDEFARHATEHYGATARALLAKDAEVRSLEGLLRECRVHVQYAEHTIGCQARYGEKTCACGIFGLLSRLDAALTDRKDQDGR